MKKTITKTAKEWFEELPDPYSRLAITSTEHKLLKNKSKSLYGALRSSFIWDKTNQGKYFWNHVANKFGGSNNAQ